MPTPKNVETPAVVSSVSKNVYVEKSYTTKVSDTDYAKVTIGVTLPFMPTVTDLEEAKKTILIAGELVEKELLAEIEKLR